MFLAASALCGFAPSVELLIAARVLQAVGARASSCRRRSACCCRSSRPRSARVATSIWGATGAVAAATGPSLGGVLVERSWRWVFLVNLLIGMAALLPGAPPAGRAP